MMKHLKHHRSLLLLLLILLVVSCSKKRARTTEEALSGSPVTLDSSGIVSGGQVTCQNAVCSGETMMK